MRLPSLRIHRRSLLVRYIALFLTPTLFPAGVLGPAARARAPPAHRGHADVQHRLALLAALPTPERLATADQVREAARRGHLRVPNFHTPATHLYGSAHRRR